MNLTFDRFFPFLRCVAHKPGCNPLLFFPHENIPNRSRLLRHGPAPGAEATVRVHGSYPFIQIPALDLILFGILAFCFQNQHVSVDQANQEVRAVFLDHAVIDVQHFEAQVIVLHPGGYLLAIVQLERIGGFPRAVVDADVDVRPLGPLAWPAGVPGAHFAGGADGVVAVEDGRQPFGVFLAD